MVAEVSLSITASPLITTSDACARRRISHIYTLNRCATLLSPAELATFDAGRCPLRRYAGRRARGRARARNAKGCRAYRRGRTSGDPWFRAQCQVQISISPTGFHLVFTHLITGSTSDVHSQLHTSPAPSVTNQASEDKQDTWPKGIGKATNRRCRNGLRVQPRPIAHHQADGSAR